MEFRLLGALEVTADGQRLDLGGIRQQTVLAMLLLEAGRAVSIRRLMEAIYGDDPPTTSRAQVQICISALRRLFSTHGDPHLIGTQSQGYAIRVENHSVDALQFEDLLRQARVARERRQPEEAVKHYRAALALWRGPVLDGIDSQLAQSAATWLVERHVTAHEDCIQLELDLGRHQELVVELRRLVEEHPLREGLRGQLMLALYRSGRQAEALQVYRQGREMMIDELGIEPNERLQQLEYAILTADTALDPPPRAARRGTPQEDEPEPPAPVRVTPGMLPTDIADFTGRDRQVELILRRLTGPDDESRTTAVPIVAIVGKGGVGKSTIAVHVAHSVAERFPDGQLFANLHGASLRPVAPMQVLERFLRALGVLGTAIPEGVEERAEMYRALLADRRILVVLDDASSESQVLPLLPGNPSSAVVITSRTRLAGLPGAAHIDVDVLGPDQSVRLLASIAGPDRLTTEPEAATTLADLCGRLPLALRIAGARLLARPHWSVAHLVARLADETRRLDELSLGDMGVRASFSLTYDGISSAARKLFRRLAVVDFHTFSAWTATALLDMDFYDAQDLLDDLADANLVEIGDPGRGAHTQYRFHDLIRVFAKERLTAEDPPAEQHKALTRTLGALLYLAEAAEHDTYGTDTLRAGDAVYRWPMPDSVVSQLLAGPESWFERERQPLVAGIRQAAAAGLADLCVGLAMTAASFFASRSYLDDWRETHQIALEAARQSGDLRGQAQMHYLLGTMSITEQRFDQAQRYMEAAEQLFRELEDDEGRGHTAEGMGFIARMHGRIDEAVRHYGQALTSFRIAGDRKSSAYVLHGLAQLRMELDDLEGAKTLLAEALEHSEAAGSKRISAQILHRMGHAHMMSGEYAHAIESFEEALRIVHEIVDPVGEALSMHGLGVAHLRGGQLTEARAALNEAHRLALIARHRVAEAHALVGLGDLAVADGDPAEAATLLRQAATLFHDMQISLEEARALIMLARALSTRDPAMAEEAISSALEIAGSLDPRPARQIRDQAAATRAELAVDPSPSVPIGLRATDAFIAQVTQDHHDR